MGERVRGKFFVLAIKKPSRTESYVQITLGAVSASDKEKSENTMYHKYTPSGEITISIDNPPAAEFFQLGKTVYVDFTEAPAE